GTVCVVGKMRDLILQLSKSSIYSTKPKIKESNIKLPFSKWKIEEDGSLKLSSKFNASVYDSVCHIFMKTNKKIKDDDLRNMFLSQDYFDACTGSVNDISKIKTRMEKAEEVA
ncbi:hypothetical protein RAG53_11905, partial [Klebsiella quasipneumoniae subsp. similipneumoniae]